MRNQLQSIHSPFIESYVVAVAEVPAPGALGSTALHTRIRHPYSTPAPAGSPNDRRIVDLFPVSDSPLGTTRLMSDWGGSTGLGFIDAHVFQDGNHRNDAQALRQ